MNDSFPKQAALAQSSDEMLEQASLTASEVTQQMLAQKLELEDKKQSVTMLQKALVIIVSDLTTNYNHSSMSL